MKFKSLLLVTVFSLLVISCKGQENKDLTKLNSPKGNWKVEKEFDENGNLIRYDSVYTWSSTKNIKYFNDFKIDSLLQSYQHLIDKNQLMLHDDIFSNFFADDSLFIKRFYQNRMELDSIRKHIIKMREEMLKNL